MRIGGAFATVLRRDIPLTGSDLDVIRSSTALSCLAAYLIVRGLLSPGGETTNK